MSNPAPGNQQAATFPTPNLRDILFYEERDARVPTNDAERRQFEYGRPHPNHQKYPDHKLVLIELIDGTNKQRWWYAADRDKQDAYNFEITYPFGGNRDFPRITRTYVIPRKEFVARQAGSLDPVFGDGHHLVDQRQSRIGQQQLDSLYVLYQAVYDRLPGPMIQEEREDETFCSITRFTQVGLKSDLVRPAQGTEFGGGRVITSQIQDGNNGDVGRLVIDVAAVPSPIQTSYQTEPETKQIATVTRQVVLSSSVPSAPPPGQEVQQRAIGCGLSARIIESIATPPQREECAVIDFTFPALLTAVNFATYKRSDDREFFSVHPVIRASFRKKVKARVVIDYHTSPPGCSELYNILPNNIAFRGVLFSLNTGPVLNNAFTLNANTSSSNPDWGVGVETLNQGASVPTATQYISDIGEEKLVDEQVRPWRFNLWRRVRTYLTLE